MVLCNDEGKTNGYPSDDDSTEENEDEDNDEEEDTDEGYRLPPQKRVRETESLEQRTKSTKPCTSPTPTSPPRQSSPSLSESSVVIQRTASQSPNLDVSSETSSSVTNGSPNTNTCNSTTNELGDNEKPREPLTRRIAMRKVSVKVEPSTTGSSKGSKSFLIEDILDFKGKTGEEETLNCSSSSSESKDSVDNIINQIKSVARQVNSSNGRGNIVRPWDTRPASSTSLICSTGSTPMKPISNSLTSLWPSNSPSILITTPPPTSLAPSATITTTTGSTIAAVASAFRSNGFSNGLLSGSRDHLHHHHLYPQPQSKQLHHSKVHHQHAPTTPSPIHHHHHHHHNVHSGKHGLTPSNIRPRSADDDSQSERSESSDATTGGPDSPANSNLLPQNSPLECLYELTNKAFDRINGDKSMDGSSDHLNIFSNRPPPKKKRKSRTAFTNTQIFELERKFIQQRYLSPADRDDLASRLGLTGPQVITWFQNRRAKQKREVEETKNDLQNHVKTMYYPDIYDNIQDLSMLKVPDIRASLQFHSKSP